MSPALEKDVIIKRINGIQAELQELKKLGVQSFEEFKTGVGFRLAQFHLYRALEGVFNIGSHILSRIPGGQATQYGEIGLKLGEFGIVARSFAEEKLVRMGRYRNRLAHFYAEITEPEVYDLLQNNLGDFETFLAAIKSLLKNPEKYRLSVE